MKWLKRFCWGGVILLVVIIAVAICLPYLNDYKKEGELVLPGLREQVTVKRDEKGMAYIYAGNLPDALMAQGFVTAQDRLFQMQLTRLLAQGRISELAGKKARSLDIRMRTIGIHRIAKKQARLLNEETRNYFRSYVDGVNAFIKQYPGDVHLEFKLAGIKPETWSVADSLCVLYYMGFSTSANIKTEVVARMLLEKVGRHRAAEIMPININPDDPADSGASVAKSGGVQCALRLEKDRTLMALTLDLGLCVGSNNWVVSPKLSPGAKPILAGDPHLDARILPGVWYPLGIITPEIRAVAANIPGLPGMALGRTSHISISMTNNYGDMQDLYVESLDPINPDRYLEGKKSLPFKVIEETLKIKDKDAAGGYREEKVKIRLTTRGPVVSNVLPGLKTKKVITLRWAPAESMGPVIGISGLLTAKSSAELHDTLAQVPMLCLNWVFADAKGNIGYRASGKLPIRSRGDGTFPHVVTSGEDNWTGWIPETNMPHMDNPVRGWLGTCNQKTVRHDYPVYYSSSFAPSYRYRRLKELMDRSEPKTVDAHWQYQRDVKNLMAEKIAPIMAKALQTHEDTRKMGEILSQWNFKDEPGLAAPTIFQAIYINFARLVFEDELGPEVTMIMLKNWYFWEERLQRMVLNGSSGWFDNNLTKDKVETLDDLFRKAGLEAKAWLGTRLGNDPGSWLWGKVHTFELVSPLRRKGKGKELLGSGPMPMGGSGETLCRGWYAIDDPFPVTNSASLRMVVDMADEDKILAVLPGGVTGRLFSKHQKDQVESFMEGSKMYWWFSEEAIAKHTK
ncbi:MAG: penicillin acylase family protein, partial [Desulfobacterales bacterium]|nr:penicillin acylase family protein [Desulfobacterales bacterium]